ncbi:MAG: tetratricopeptide repeat protein [Desulfobacterales bacterium]|nr:tetratricopeptide repeat protein [Desulfobacterales bacterium]
MVAHPDSTCPNCGRPLKRAAVCTFCKSKDPYVVNPIYYVWLVVSAAMVVSMAGYRIYKTGESIFISFKRMAGSAVYEVTLASAGLPISRNPAPSIQIERVAEIRQMLKDGREIELNAALDSYQKAFEGNHALDTAVCDAFYVFDTPQTSYEGLLSQWAERFPTLYQPHLAMAVYYHAVGWDKRGARSAADTPKAAMAEMEYYLSMTEERLTEALRINPNLVLGHSLLISIYNAMGKDAEENEAIEKACALFPDSFQIGVAAVWAKQPRWGGSYAAMEKLAKRMENAAVRNPHLTALYGFVYFDQANILARNEKFKAALALYEKAMTFGDACDFYLARAKLFHYHLKDDESALVDAERCIALRPTVDRGYRMKSRILFALEDFEGALETLWTAASLRPGDTETTEWKQWAYKSLFHKGHNAFKEDRQAAITYYSFAIEIDGEQFEPLYWRGVAYLKEEQWDEARWDFDKAIELNPTHFESVRLIDAVLAREKQWETIIGYWDRFLEYEPEHAEAYLERSGAHYHNGDRESAVSDLHTACDLGNRKACSLLSRFQ